MFATNSLFKVDARKVISNFESKPHEMTNENLQMALFNAKKLILGNLKS